MTRTYVHPEADALLRPDVGTQAQFRKRKPPKTYRYDSSLSPALDWDGQNPAREVGEWLLGRIEKAAALPPPHLLDRPEELKGADGRVRMTVRGLQDAVDQLRRLAQPFLNWAGKAERLSFEVPTLPLFVHERLSTKAILETIKGHKRDRQLSILDLFGDPERPIADQVLKTYEHKEGWVNRLILGDSLVVMNSLLHYEGLGGQVQMIYMDPPYGVKFGSNFQPFVRKRDVKHNDDQDMTREPEMVKAYRDTWELGLHSYLTYLRDRLLLCRDLLAPTGSIFVQISDTNVHDVRKMLDEVFGSDNFIAIIVFQKTAGAGSPSLGTEVLASVCDYLLWYGKDRSRTTYRQLYLPRRLGPGDLGGYTWVQLADGTRRRMTAEERSDLTRLPSGAVIFTADNLTSQTGVEKTRYPVEFEGRLIRPAKGVWKTSEAGMMRLKEASRLILLGDTLRYVRYFDDFPMKALNNVWDDTIVAGYSDPKIYSVQTSTKVVQRCVLMTTNPGDLVLDPTCGSGTTAYVAEQWGRRWITIDTSRVPLALTRQRLLTATYPYFELKDEQRGPAGGFVFKRKQNKKGEEVGGIVPHVTLKSIANNEPPAEETLVDRPEIDGKITRVTGPLTVEATIPTPVDWDETATGSGGEARAADPIATYGSSIDRMLEVLRRSPVLHLGAGKTVTLKNVRPPAKTLSLSAEALVENGQEKPVALVFGPESGAVSEKLVFEAAREAYMKGYGHLYVIGFAIQPHARTLIEQCAEATGVPATYIQATPDVMMGDLLKTTRSSQIFSVCGLPDVVVRSAKGNKAGTALYQVELKGLDVFDPTTMELETLKPEEVPAWFLDTDYNGLCFHVSQAFFPRTAAWDDLKKALKAEYEESVWDHLAGTVSAPFEGGQHGQIAVKVIDTRGNELLVVKSLTEART